jgi:hypothetical protein
VGGSVAGAAGASTGGSAGTGGSSTVCPSVEFPADAGVIDVTQPPYGAIPDDTGDDTTAIQAALDAGAGDNQIIHLPNGVYVVSDTLRWSGDQKRTILQGQSRGGTILKVPDNSPGFGDAAAPRAVIWTGEEPAQRFRNAILDLTVDTGSGNPGAIGIQFIANNQGTLRRVSIVSSDGQGVVGLDMAYTGEIGPLLVRDLAVRGFDTGIKTFWPTAGVTFEHVLLEDQNVYGWHNAHQATFVRGLRSRGQVPVIYNELDTPASMTLVEATLEGYGAAADVPAIINEKSMYVRDLVTSGFAKAIHHDDKGRGNGDAFGPNVDEWLSHGSGDAAFEDSPRSSLRLPIEEPPYPPCDPLADWVSPLEFDGTDSERLQQAIDSGKGTVYLPNGSNLQIDERVVLRGNVRRLLGTEARLAGSGTLVLGEGEAPVVVLERIDMNYASIQLEHASSRTWLISSVSGGTYRALEGAGDLFLDDVVMEPLVFGRQRVWARQLNQETDTQAAGLSAKVSNRGGDLWVLGVKTERPGTVIETTDGGRTEVLGGFVYATAGEKVAPMFSIIDASASFAGVAQRSYAGTPFVTWYSEQRGTETRTVDEPTSVLYVGHSP